jgi:hypothetical protein
LCFRYFSGRVLLFGLDHNSPFNVSRVTNIMTGVTTIPGGDGGLGNFLSTLASNRDPSDLHLLSSWDCRCAL